MDWLQGGDNGGVHFEWRQAEEEETDQLGKDCANIIELASVQKAEVELECQFFEKGGRLRGFGGEEVFYGGKAEEEVEDKGGGVRWKGSL